MMDEGREKQDDGREAGRIGSVRELKVYKLAFQAAMEIFEISKSFPKEETYSLTDQVRRASRSICTNLSEGWRKRRYKAVFINKLSDAGHCKYIDSKTFERLDEKYEHIFAMLLTMEQKADSFCNVR